MSDKSSFSPPKPANLNRAAVSQIAEYFSNKFDVTKRNNIADIVDDVGGIVFYDDFWNKESDISGSLMVHPEGKFEIFIPMYTSIERDNFTIAHELGHYFLHYIYRKSKGDEIKGLLANRYGSGRVEWEANWFAAAFLMPQSQFRDRFQHLNGDIDSIASEFNVSREAARVRANVLGLRHD